MVNNNRKNLKAVKKKNSATASTTRSTAGPGFRFEDQVAAWLLLQALTGQELPGVKAKASRLQMQVNALGWQHDDVLFTADAAPGGTRHLAISCKSNEQVSAAGLPVDFVERAWKQWDSTSEHPMRRDADCLMLATRQRHNAFQATWSEVKLAAADADLVLGLARIMQTAKYRRIFGSVKNPAKAAGLSVSDWEALALIRHMEVLPLDFDIAGGHVQQLAENACRSLLLSSSLTEARALWTDLVGKAEALRLSPSTLNIEDLWPWLRSRYALKDHPDYAAAWARLRAITADYKGVIQTALPSSYVLKREANVERLKTAISNETVCVVYGESGTGKSALVRTVLDSHFPDTEQVWLGPEELDAALSEARRPAFGLSVPLLDVLRSSPKPETVLVLDAAERLIESSVLKGREIIAALAADFATIGCRVLIVGQSDAGVSGTLLQLAGLTSPSSVEIPRLEVEEVFEVLWATNGLQWLASQDDAVEALGNLKALAWVIDGAALFQTQSGPHQMSLTTIADRLWPYWTGGKPSLQRLLMRLGEREASFEHSFALTSFEQAEAVELNALPKACPLKQGNNNRYQFEHDLAADWARFQRLKQDSNDVNTWAALAGNPLWNNALRMLGQYLLRQPDGMRTQWDVAFEEAEQLHNTMPLAADILLDALFLDPNAERFLDQRADILFANNAKRLKRLLRRFEHVASVPGRQPKLTSGGLDISLYLEAQYRKPIYLRWPAIANFLTSHRDRIVPLTSPVVAAVCERWLTTTPPGTPFRKEFAEIALAVARELQYANEVTVVLGRDPEKAIYSAAFASAADLPDEVAEWALEMVRRRPTRADIAARVREFRRQQEEEHRQKLETDEQYRNRFNDRRSFSPGFSSKRKLPPWPLGPQHRVERRFRESVLGSPMFQVLIRKCPAAASEILVAAIIEDSPEEEYGNRSLIEDELGIEYEQDSYPTAYWKSPFFGFLQIDPETALDALNKLVNFCTERWAREKIRHGGTPRKLLLTLSDASPREFTGGSQVFAWSHENSSRNGQLFSALAALEKWLCLLIDHGTEITTYLNYLLQNSNSTAVVGVLVNVGKYKPDLFKGPLMRLLGEATIYFWDQRRVANAAIGVDLSSWARGGELMFQMGRDWVLAPYRKVKLEQTASGLITEDDGVAQYLLTAIAVWEAPIQEKAAIEFRMLKAELDHRNYRHVPDPASGQDKLEFNYPADVMGAAEAFTEGVRLARQINELPYRCRTVLGQTGKLTSDSASYLAELMDIASSDADIKLTDDFKIVARVAAASTLLLKAPEWLAENPDVASRARTIINGIVGSIGSDSSDSRSRAMRGAPEMEFVAQVVVHDWIERPSKESDGAVMRVMTSGDDAAVGVLFSLAYRHREALGHAWWRLLFLALLRSGLSILAPRYGDEDDIELNWQRWLRWLRTRRVSSVIANIAQINPLGIAARVERFERRRWQQRYDRDGRGERIKPDRRMSGGLDTHFLAKAFDWLFADGAGLSDPAEQARLLSAFWTHEIWCLRGSTDDDDDDFKTRGQFGYAIVWSLARLTGSSRLAEAPAIWNQVFAIGPRGHHEIEAFLTEWFTSITEATDISDFAKRWRPMVEYALRNKQWADEGKWYYAQRLERYVLGFAAGGFITRASGHATLIGGMRDLYKSWAETRLPSDQDNLAGFCGFLSNNVGHVLRMDGLQWIAAVMRADPETGKWYRETTGNAFMGLLEAAILEDAEELAKSPDARRALVELTAHAVARQLPRALPLQERVRRLR